MRRCISAILTVLLIAALIITNPGMNKYVKWYEKDIIPKSQGSIITTIGERLREPVIKSSTTVKNYGFLSHYTTVIGSYQINSTGILNCFIIDGLSALVISMLLSFSFMILMILIIL